MPYILCCKNKADSLQSVSDPKFKQEAKITVKVVDKQIDELKANLKYNRILINLIVGSIALIVGWFVGFILHANAAKK